MKFKGNPNQLCRITKIRKHLVRKIPKAIRFDNEGVYETENPYLIERFKTKFEVIEEIEEVEDGLLETEEEEIKEDKEVSYSELQKMYSELTGKSAVGVSKADILKELEV